MQDTTGNGKGDTPRPVDRKTYSINFDRIFGKGKKLPRLGSLHPANKKSDQGGKN